MARHKRPDEPKDSLRRGQVLAHEMATITNWLAGEYAAVDNKLYGILIDKPKLCEQICSTKRPGFELIANRKAVEKQVESTHDWTLKAITKLRQAAYYQLERVNNRCELKSK